MSTMQLALQLKIAQTGLENIEALIKELRAAGQDTSAFEQQADVLRQTLAELGRKAEAVETFKRLKQATTDAADALRQAQDKAQALGRAYAQLESPTKKQTAELERAKRAVREASDAHQASVLALQNHRNAMADMGVSTRNLSGQMAAIKSASAGARQAMAGLETTLKSTVADLKASGDAAQASARGAEAASKAWGGLKSGLAAGAGFAAAQAGINTLSGTLDKLKHGIVSIVETGARFETLRTQLETLYGSADKAEQAFAWINDFTASTPFELEQVTDGFIKLKAMGLDPMDGSFQAIADQASALGASGETLNGIVLALGQAWSKQKLQGEEALQLIERGVPVWELLAKATGRNAAELQDMSAKGLLGRDAIKALMDEMGRANAGAATAAMQTFNGQLSNLQDNWTEFLRRIADAGAFDFFKQQIEQVNQAIARMKADGRLDEYAKTVSDAIVSMGEAIKSGVVFVRDYADTLLLLGQVAAALKLTQAAQQMTLFAAQSVLAGDAAEKTAGRIKSAFAVLNAFLIGQQIGGYLKDQFLEVELAGIALAAGLTKAAASAKFAFSVLKSPINAAEAFAEYQQKLRDIDAEYADLAQAAIDARNKGVGGANDTAAAISGVGAAGKQAGADVQAGAEQGKTGLTNTATAAQELADRLTSAGGEAEKTQAALAGIDLTTPQGVQDMLDGLLLAGKAASAIGPAIDASLSSMDAGQLAEFGANIKAAFDGGQLAAEDFARLTDQILAASFQKLGITAETALGRISPAAQEAIAAVDGIAQALDGAADGAPAKMEALGAAIEAAVNRADSTAALEALRGRVESLGAAGKLSGDQVAQAMSLIAAKTAEVDPQIQRVEAAFRRLGLQSQSQLRQLAQQAAADFATVAQSGQAAPEQIQAAFQRYAQAAVTANNGVADAQLRAEAAAQGLVVAVDKAGQVQVLTAAEATRANLGIVDSQGQVAAGYERIAGAAGAAGEAVGKVGAAAEKTGEQTEQAGAAASSAVSEFDAFAAAAQASIAGVNQALAEDIQSAIQGATGGADGLRRALNQIDGSGLGKAADEAERLTQQAEAAEQAMRSVARVGLYDAGTGALDFFGGYLGQLKALEAQALRSAAANTRSMRALEEEAARLASSTASSNEDLRLQILGLDATDAEMAAARRKRALDQIQLEIRLQEIALRKASLSGDNAAAEIARLELDALREKLKLTDEYYTKKEKKDKEERARAAREEREAAKKQREQEQRTGAEGDEPSRPPAAPPSGGRPNITVNVAAPNLSDRAWLDELARKLTTVQQAQTRRGMG